MNSEAGTPSALTEPTEKTKEDERSKRKQARLDWLYFKLGSDLPCAFVIIATTQSAGRLAACACAEWLSAWNTGSQFRTCSSLKGSSGKRSSSCSKETVSIVSMQKPDVTSLSKSASVCSCEFDQQFSPLIRILALFRGIPTVFAAHENLNPILRHLNRVKKQKHMTRAFEYGSVSEQGINRRSECLL